MNSKLIAIAGIALSLSPNVMLSAQEATARTVQYHSQDIVPMEVTSPMCVVKHRLTDIALANNGRDARECDVELPGFR